MNPTNADDSRAGIAKTTTSASQAGSARMWSATVDITGGHSPGPQVEAYLLGCPLRAVYPLVPLYKNQALGIALFSYDGRLFWGFNADWDAVPDLHDLVEAVAHDFQALRALAGEAPAGAARAAGG